MVKLEPTGVDAVMLNIDAAELEPENALDLSDDGSEYVEDVVRDFIAIPEEAQTALNVR